MTPISAIAGAEFSSCFEVGATQREGTAITLAVKRYNQFEGFKKMLELSNTGPPSGFGKHMWTVRKRTIPEAKRILGYISLLFGGRIS